MSEESDANFNEAMRALIIRVQKNQDLWNHYLSWFYVQQKSFRRPSFRKSHLQAQSESLSNIVNLANLSIQRRRSGYGQRNFDFVIENTKDLQLLIQAQTWIKMKIDKAQDKDFAAINRNCLVYI
jgi:hypothetical protein